MSLWRHQVLLPYPRGQEGGVLLVVLVDWYGVVALLGVKAVLPALGWDTAGLQEGGLHRMSLSRARSVWGLQVHRPPHFPSPFLGDHYPMQV